MLFANPTEHAGNKYVELDLYFVREKVHQRSLIVQHIPCVNQIADILTKVISSSRFYNLWSKLRVNSFLLWVRGAVKKTLDESWWKLVILYNVIIIPSFISNLREFVTAVSMHVKAFNMVVTEYSMHMRGKSCIVATPSWCLYEPMVGLNFNIWSIIFVFKSLSS